MKLNFYLLFLIIACLAGQVGYAQAPTITSLSPASGSAGTVVTINGTNLTGTTAVVLRGIPVNITPISSTQVSFVVPAQASTGPVRLTTSGGTVLSSSNFTVTRASSSLTYALRSNSFNSINVSSYSTPAITDLDHDGLIDLLVGRETGEVSHYEQSAANSLTFTLRATNLSGLTGHYNSIVSVTDIDGDGRLDMVVGSGAGNFKHYEQSAVNSTSFTQLSDDFNNIFSAGGLTYQIPHFTDIDGDGLLDLLVGDEFLSRYEQTTPNGGTFNQLNNQNFGPTADARNGGSMACVVDLDGDGRLDMLVGNFNGKIVHYEQTSANSAAFTQISTAFNGLNLSTYTTPAITDIDGDGLLDLLIGGSDGVIRHYEQTTPPVITSNPVSKSVCTGSSTTFTVAASNATSYQWQVNTGSGFANLTNTAPYSGVTSATLTINNVTGLDGYQYLSVATGDGVSVNSNPATLTVNPLPTAGLSNNGPLTCAQTSVTLTASGGTSYTFTSPGGAVLGTSGVTTTRVVSSPGSYSVRVGNASGCVSTTSTSVVSNTAVITTNNPATNTVLVNTPFSQTFTATGGVAPCSYSLASGSLPTGLSLASSGVLSGTPTQGGSFTLVVRGQDANGCFDLGPNYVLTVNATPTIAGFSASPSAVCVGSPITFTATVGNVTGGYNYTLTNGTSSTVSTASGSGFSQTLTAAGNGSQVFTLTVGDNGFQASATTNVTVNALPTAGLSNNGPLTCSQTSVTLTASGGSSYTFTSPGGAVLGTSGATTTRVVSSPGSYSVRVGNASGCVSTTSTTVISNTAVVTTSNPVTSTATVNTAFSQTFTATGGVSPYSFSIASGTLPIGLSLATTGLLSGIPTQSGSFTITVRGSDANGCSDLSPAYVLTVNSGCASVYTVTNTSDAGAGSLRQAMDDVMATTCPGPFTITATASGTINLASVLPDITKDIAFIGPGAANLTVRRSSVDNFRIFTIPGSNTVSFNGFTIADGLADVGGAINSNGTLTFSNCVFRNNQAIRLGGAIYSFGALTVTNSLFTGNVANGQGGGGIRHDGSRLTVSTSTFTSNSAVGSSGSSGGGISALTGGVTITNSLFSNNEANFFGGGLELRSDALVVNCTISGNTSSGGGIGGVVTTSSSQTYVNTTITLNRAGSVAGLAQRGGAMPTLINCIVANNFRGSDNTSAQIDVDANLNPASSNNVIGTSGSGLTNGVNGNQVGVTNPLLAPLGNYGGPTQTHALLPGSPAINAGTASGAPTTDQRGISRVGVTDIGSFESRGFALALTSGSSQSATVGTAFANPLRTTVSSANSEPVDGGVVTYTGPGSGAGISPNPVLATIASGVAGASVTANATAGGPYTVAATATGASPAINFSLTNTPAAPTIAGFNTLANTVCAGSPITFTATVGNVSPPYAFTLSNGTNSTMGSAGSTAFSQNLTASGSGPQTFTLTVSDGSPSARVNTTVTVTAAPSATIAYPGFSFPTSSSPVSVSQTGTAGGTYSSSPAGLSLNTGTGQITPASSSPGSYTVTYTIAASGGCGPFSTTAPVGIQQPQADLAITVTDGVTTAVPGNPVTYTIIVSNAGPSDVRESVVVDAFPAILTGVNWTAVGAGGGSVGSPSGTGDIIQAVNLPAGGSVTFTATATVSSSATGSLTNTARTSSPDDGVIDVNTGNNSATDTDELTPRADLSITVTDGVTTAVPGNPVTYTIIVSNAGPSDAPGAQVADMFPASLTGVSWMAVGAGGGSVGASGTGNINESVNLPAGGSVTFIVTATVSLSATGTLANTATVTAPGGVTDPIPGNNSATDSDPVIPVAPIIMGLSASPSAVCVGSPVTFTATIGNVTGTYAYTLTNGNNPLTGSSSNMAFSQNLTASGSGSQSFTLTVSSSSQVATASTSVTVNAPPVAGLTNNGPLSCAQTSVTLTASGGSSYTFISPDGTVLAGNGDMRVVSSPGSYSVSVANASGCVSTTSTGVLSNTATAVATLSASPSTTLTCAQTSLTLTAGGGSSYAFAGPGILSQSGNAAIVNASGVYSVTVSNESSGCVSSTSITISRDASTPVATLFASPSTTLTCTQTSLTLTAGGGNRYAFDGPGILSQSGNRAVVNAAGTYSVTVLSGNGCSAVASTSVSSATAIVSVTNPAQTLTTPGAPFSQAFTATGGISPYSFSLASGSLPTGLTLSVAGVLSGSITQQGSFPITVSATDANGCTGTGTVYTLSIPTTQFTVLSRDPENGNLNTNTLKPYLLLQNDGSSGIPYGELTVRYWLTVENPVPLRFDINYAQMGNDKIHLSYVPISPVRQGATGYIEFSFDPSAGSLGAGNNAVIQDLINKQDYSMFFQGDDYSYANNANFVANPRITAYRNGVLVYGIEPATGPGGITPLTLMASASPTTILTTGSTTLSAQVSGGTSGYSYVFSGPGTIQASGNTATVSNLPPGQQTVTVTVTDATAPVNQTISTTVSIQVTAPPVNQPPVASSNANQTATQGVPYTYTANAFGDETPGSLTYTASFNPANNLTFNPATRVIQGIPGNTGVTSVTITATDPGSLSASTIFTITVSAAPVVGATQLTVLSRDPDNGQLNTNTLKPYLQLQNDGGSPIPYGEITVRYWLTLENPVPLRYEINYAQLGSDKVHLNYVPISPLRQGATGYIEFSFDPSAGSLGAGSNSGPIQDLINKQDYSYFNQGDDYSYVNTGNFTANPRITAYRNGTLIYGTEPPVGARLSAENADAPLQVRVLGNPIYGSELTVEVQGAGGKPLRLRVLDLNGHLVGEQAVERAGNVEQQRLPVGDAPAGLLFLQVSTPSQSQTTKVLRVR